MCIRDRGHTAEAPERPEHLDTVTAAVFGERMLKLVYTNNAGRKSMPTVSPLGVIEKRGTWYLVAGSNRSRHAEPRSYRVDRIIKATITEVPAARPDDFDLVETWRRINENFARESLTVTAWGWARSSWRYDRLQSILGRRLTEHETDDEGRVRIEITGWSVDALVGELGSMGRAIEITSPPELRAELAALGADLCDLYT